MKTKMEKPQSILVIEDDQEMLHLLKRTLELEGYEVALAADHAKGLVDAHGGSK